MPQVTRIGDMDNAYPIPDISTEGSQNVFVNGLGIHRVGDKDSDDDTLSVGSATVMINGMACGRLGDQDSDKEVMITASLNVFAG